mmetsp:Transcript_25339/g.49420  ORF Transcript_25339/g.49420 Transcript_25339/m.49420 type:complete len:207 (-) Transcript_25339:272-892(-)
MWSPKGPWGQLAPRIGAHGHVIEPNTRAVVCRWRRADAIGALPDTGHALVLHLLLPVDLLLLLHHLLRHLTGHLLGSPVRSGAAPRGLVVRALAGGRLLVFLQCWEEAPAHLEDVVDGHVQRLGHPLPPHVRDVAHQLVPVPRLVVPAVLPLPVGQDRRAVVANLFELHHGHPLPLNVLAPERPVRPHPPLNRRCDPPAAQMRHGA